MNTFTGYATALNLITTTTGHTGSSAQIDGVYPGTACTVFTHGTLTPATIYASDGLALTNPFLVNLDASFVFMGAASSYDLLFTDPLAPAQPSVPMISALSVVIQGALNVRDYGAVGDGVADDTPAIQAALTAAVSGGFGCVVVLPIGTYLTTTPLTIATPSLQLLGLGVDRTILRYIGSGQAIRTTVQLDGAVVANLTFDLTAASAANTDIIDLRLGSNRSQFIDVYFKVNAQVRDGIVLRGQNPDTSAANAGQFANYFHNVKGQGDGTGIATGYMIKLFGANLTDARCNANHIHNCFFNSWAAPLYINGQGNTWTSCIFENLTHGILMTGTNVFGNYASGNYYDNGATEYLSLTGVTAGNDGIVTIVEDAGVTIATITDGTARADGIPRYTYVSRLAQPNFLAFAPIVAGNPTATQVYLNGSSGWLTIRGGAGDPSPRLIMSGRNEATVATVVSPAGGLSVGIADQAGAEERGVKTADGSTFVVYRKFDRTGNLTLGDAATGTYQDVTISGSNPAAPAAGYVRLFVKADGLYVKLPAGTVVGPLS